MYTELMNRFIRPYGHCNSFGVCELLASLARNYAPSLNEFILETANETEIYCFLASYIFNEPGDAHKYNLFAEEANNVAFCRIGDNIRKPKHRNIRNFSSRNNGMIKILSPKSGNRIHFR